MQVHEAGQAGEPFVEPGVVLHGARPQRIEARIDGEVLLAQAREVTHNLGLRQSRQPDLALAREPAEPVFARRRPGEVDAGAPGAVLLEDKRLLDLEPAVTAYGARRSARGGHHKAASSAPAKAAMSASELVSLTATSRRPASSGSRG